MTEDYTSDPFDLPPPKEGHNKPPEDDLDAFKETTDAELADLKKRIRDYEVGLERAPENIQTEHEASLVVTFLAQGKALEREAEAKRVDLKKPLDDRGAFIQKRLAKGKGDIVKNLGLKLTMLLGRQHEYQRKKEAEVKRQREEAEREAREQERLAREAAAKAEQEAAEQAKAAQTIEDRRKASEKIEEAAQANAAAEEEAKQAAKAEREKAKPVHTGGVYGGTSFTRKFWTFKITDESQIPASALWPFIDREAKEKAIRAFMKVGGRKMRGVEIFETSQTQVRS